MSKNKCQGQVLKDVGTEKASADIQSNPYGGKTSEISELETSFPHRAGNKYKIHYSVNWNDEGVKAADGNTDLIKRVYEFDSLCVKVNKVFVSEL